VRRPTFYCSVRAADGRRSGGRRRLFGRPTDVFTVAPERPADFSSGRRSAVRPSVTVAASGRVYCSGGLVDVSGRSSGQRNFYGRRSSGSLNDRPTFRASDFPFFSILYNGVKCRTYLGLQRMMTCRKGRDETDSPKNSLSTPICFLSSPNFIRSFFLERPPDFSSAGNFIRASNVARISDFSV